MKKIQIEFETITPIYTGDAWGKNSEIKASSVMGSLRFWFEVYCHFAGIEVKEKEELKDKDYQKILKNLKEDISEGKNIDDIDKYIFDKLPLTLSSKIFGCTGWKSRIEIEGIRYLDNYCFGNRLNLPSKICVKKKDNTKGKCPSRSNNFWSVWYLPQPYFFGKFEITFKTTNEIRDNILFPLLDFIEKYAFIGAKNNIGYGRIRILNPNTTNYNQIKTSLFGENRDISKNIFTIKKLPINLNRLNFNKMEIFSNNIKNDNLIEVIKSLISKKAELRKQENNKYIRHYKFGSIAKDIYMNKKHNIEIQGANATKIIPLISIENGEYIGKFLSIWGIQNIGADK